MIYLIYGTDSHKARTKLHELLDLAKKKKPEAELFKLTSENWTESQLDELLVSHGLFEQKYTVVLDNLFEKKDTKSYVLGKVEEMKESDQIFLMLEGGVDSASLKKIEKYAEKVQEFVKSEKKATAGSEQWSYDRNFNIFSVTDGLLLRDKKKLWVSYLESLKKGGAPEEVHGIFFWQIKNMILSSRAKSQAETGLSPYVYKNALTGARKYRTEDLIKMSGELLDMTHKVRNGEGDMGVMLEKWVLGI